MTFADPIWLWGAFLLIPVIVLQTLRLSEKFDKSSAFVAKGLRDSLIHGSSKKSRIIKLFILSFSYILILLAMARPQWGFEEQQSYSKGRTVMLAIDSSRSMLAEDLTPNRLTRAKLAAYDLIDALPEDLIGLMAFSGSASVMVPITPDRDALRESIDQLDTYAVARGGTNLAEAIKESTEVLMKSETKSHALVLFTDGENLDGDAVQEAKKAQEKGTIIIAIGLGSENGSIIPDDRSRGSTQTFIKDESGNLVKSKLDSKALKEIADSANGIFLRLDSNSLNSSIINDTLKGLDTKETQFRDQQVPIERFGWPLGIGLLLIIGLLLSDFLKLILMDKSKVLTCLLTILMISSSLESKAGVISQALDSFNAGKFEDAVKYYEEAIAKSRSLPKNARLKLGLGASAFKANDYDKASRAFGEALLSKDLSVQSSAYYNLGNSLFRKGQKSLDALTSEEGKQKSAADSEMKSVISDWEGAIEHYESNLKINPDNNDAKHNIEVVRKKLEELNQDQENQDQENQDQENQDQENQDQENQDQENQDQESQGEETLNENQKVNPDTGYSKEQAQRQLEALANEQFLRALPRRGRARFKKDW